MSIEEVYSYNLEESFRLLSALSQDYPLIGVDTEFPGYFDDIDELAARTGQRPISQLSSTYARFKMNIDNLKLIQLGLSLSNEHGETPNPSTFEFNFIFDRNNDVNEDASIELLIKHEVPFDKMLEDGIEPLKFSYYFMASGLLFNKQLRWIYFHGYCDLGYLVKSVTLNALPLSVMEFNELAEELFPHYFDLKLTEKWDSSLQALASYCGVEREGIMHEAGSDSMVTVGVWVKCSEGKNYSEYDRKVYGLDDQ